MSHQDVTVSNMQWYPALIKLHQVGKEFPDTKVPTPTFADPTMIQAIYVGVTRTREGDDPDSVVECTVVQFKTRDYLTVTETPEAVARLRDEAFGYKQAPPALSAV